MSETYWKSRAKRLLWRANAGWWLQRFIPGAVAVGVASAVLLLAIRSMGQDVRVVLVAMACALLIVAWVSWRLARPKFLSWDDAWSRLDAREFLHNRLVSASSGVGDWPPPSAESFSTMRWNVKRIVLPLGAAVCVLLVAAFVPVQSSVPPPAPPLAEPTAWGAVDSALELLREEELIREESLERIAEQVDALRQQPQDQWYRQHSMEASDHLRQQVGVAARELQHALERAAVALAMADEQGATWSPSEQSALHDLLRDALQAMEGGTLQLDESLLDALKELDASQWAELSEAELAELEQKLSEAGECLSACAGACGVAGGEEGEGAGEGELAGMGGVNRGPGSAPLTLHSRAPLSRPDDPFAVGNDDMSQAALGDRLAISEDSHEVDTSHYRGAINAGALATPGGGGEAVWRTPVSPREQRLLQTYFE
jgi:hypothetical protein